MTTANPLFSLDGRVALITGASRGLGLAIAEGLAEAGAAVIANGRNADTLEVVARNLRRRTEFKGKQLELCECVAEVPGQATLPSAEALRLHFSCDAVLGGRDPGRLPWNTEYIEVISRRRTLSLLAVGLVAVPVLGLGSASDAAAETAGQERRGDRKDKRHEKQGNRQEKREDRRQ